MGVTPEERIRSGFRKAVRDRRKEAVNRFESRLPARERELLQALLSNAESREAVLPRLIETGSFQNLTARPIFETLVRMREAGAEITFASVEARLENPQKALLHELISADEMEDHAGSHNGNPLGFEQALRCLESLESDDHSQARNEIKGRIRTAERAGRFEEALELMKKLEELDRSGKH
jgi:tetratricopeptide (TPR) repeat protein